MYAIFRNPEETQVSIGFFRGYFAVSMDFPIRGPKSVICIKLKWRSVTVLLCVNVKEHTKSVPN